MHCQTETKMIETLAQHIDFAKYPLIKELIYVFGLDYTEERFVFDIRQEQLNKEQKAKQEADERLERAKKIAIELLKNWENKAVFEAKIFEKFGKEKGQNGLNFWYSQKIIKTKSVYLGFTKEKQEIVYHDFSDFRNADFLDEQGRIEKAKNLAKEVLPSFVLAKDIGNIMIAKFGYDKAKELFNFWADNKIISKTEIYADFNCKTKETIYFFENPF